MTQYDKDIKSPPVSPLAGSSQDPTNPFGSSQDPTNPYRRQDTSGVYPGGGQNPSAFDEVSQEGQTAIEKTKEKTRQRIVPYLSSRKEQLLEQLNQTAGALRETGNHMDKSRGGDLIRMSAQKIEQLCGYLGARDVDELVDELRNFARARPWTVVGGAFVVGMAAARFLKASARHTTSEL